MASLMLVPSESVLACIVKVRVLGFVKFCE